MSSKETHKPFSTQFEKVGLVLVLPNENIVNEALRLRSLGDHEHESLNETLNARPEVNVDSVKSLIESFQLTYSKLKKILENLTNGQVSSLPSIHEKDLNEAQELSSQLNKIKSEIEEVLLKEATLNPATGPGDDLVVLPTSDNIFTRPNEAIPRIYYDIETQKPLTLQEEVLLKLFESYQSGSKDTWCPEGKPKPINVVKDEIRKVLTLGGYGSGQINAIFINEIDPVTAEIGKFNQYQGKEKKEKLDKVYERVVKVAQDKLFNRNHRFRVATSPVVLPDLSNVPTLGEEDILHDPRIDTGEFHGIGNKEDSTLNAPTMTDVINSFPLPTSTDDNTNIISDVTPVIPVGVLHSSPVLPDNNPFESSTVNPPPVADSTLAIAPEASVLESEPTPEEVYSKEKERYQNLRDSVYNKHLGLKYYYELDRAEIHIQTIDYVINDSEYIKKVREKKIRQNTEALAKINERLAEGLREIIQEPAVIVPESSPIPLTMAGAEPVLMASENEEPSYLNLVHDDPLMRTNVIPDSLMSTPQSVSVPKSVVSPSLPTEIPSEPIVVSNTVSMPNPTSDSFPVVPENKELHTSTKAKHEPLMEAHVDVYREASERNSRLTTAGLTDARQLDTVPFKDRERMRGDYAKERTLAIESRFKFKEAETSYQTKLKEFYKNRSIFSKASGAIRTFFGGQPKLPPELVKLQTIYKYTKEQYALQLRDAWVKRTGAFADNKVLDQAKPSIKKAFAKKFVLEPRNRLLDVQAEAYEMSVQNSKFKPIMSLARKHKTALRWLGLGVAAGTGAAAGGALVAGFNVARWGVATFGGAAVANEVYRRKDKGINEAVSNLSLEKEKIENEFTLMKLNEFDDALAFGSLEVERARLKQKVYAVGAAVAFGGAINSGTSLIDIPSSEVPTNPRVSGVVTNELPVSLSTEEASSEAQERRLLEIQESIRKIHESVAKDNARIAAEKLGVSYRPLSPVTNELPLNLETTPQTLLQMSGVRVPQYSQSGELLAEISVSNIRLQGLNMDSLKESTLPEAKVLEIYSHLNYKINDLLAARPNFSQFDLEKHLFNELQNIYGAEDWWVSAKINEVKIDSIETTNQKPTPTVPLTRTLTAEVSHEDTINSIKANVVDNSLVAVNNINENENTPLDQSDTFVEKEPIIYTRSGGLSIEEADEGIASVPIIKAVYNPAEVAETAVFDDVLSQREINHLPLEETKPPQLPPDPEEYVDNGNYTQSPAFIEYVNSEYGGMERFNKIVLREALGVEGDTYDIFNKWLNEYQSPYEMSLAKMTMSDLKEAFGGPELGSRVVEIDATGFPKEYNTDAIKEYASANNFNYETVRKWLIKLEDLKQEFPYEKETTLEDLFARSIIKADLLTLQSKGVSA